jgi:hypothetical protein
MGMDACFNAPARVTYLSCRLTPVVVRRRHAQLARAWRGMGQRMWGLIRSFAKFRLLL